MSTKIYNGAKFKSNNILEVLDQLKNIRTELLKICNTSEYVPDKNLIGYIKYKEYDVYDKVADIDIIKKIKDDIDLFDETAYRFIPFKVTIYVIPHTDGNIYAGVFCDNHKALKYLQPYILDYHYQNQTDKPDEIPDDEWDTRKKIWNEIFDKYWSFPEVGLRYDVLSGKDFSMWKQIKNACATIIDENEQNFENIYNGIYSILNVTERIDQFNIDSIELNDMLYILYKNNNETTKKYLVVNYDILKTRKFDFNGSNINLLDDNVTIFRIVSKNYSNWIKNKLNL